MKRLNTFGLGLAALLFAASPIAMAPANAAVSFGIRVGPTFAPPAPRHEVHRRAPFRGASWVDGRWAWRNGHWQWVNGYWGRPPRTNAHWTPGRWEHRGRNYVWVDGSWR